MTARYLERRLGNWLKHLADDKIAPPDLQRSYVSKRGRVAKYLAAFFSERPTGVFLVLEKAEREQFDMRTLKNVDSDVARARKLVIDGPPEGNRSGPPLTGVEEDSQSKRTSDDLAPSAPSSNEIPT